MTYVACHTPSGQLYIPEWVVSMTITMQTVTCWTPEQLCPIGMPPYAPRQHCTCIYMVMYIDKASSLKNIGQLYIFDVT